MISPHVTIYREVKLISHCDGSGWFCEYDDLGWYRNFGPFDDEKTALARARADIDKELPRPLPRQIAMLAKPDMSDLHAHR
jgi:hypothetical protein